MITLRMRMKQLWMVRPKYYVYVTTTQEAETWKTLTPSPKVWKVRKRDIPLMVWSSLVASRGNVVSLRYAPRDPKCEEVR